MELHSQKLLSNINTDSIKAIKLVLRTLDKQIKSLEKHIESLIKEHFNEVYKNILSIKGIDGSSEYLF